MGAWGRFEGSRGRLVAKTRAEKSVRDDVAKLPNPSHQADRRQAGFARLNPPGVQTVGLMCAKMMKATRRITARGYRRCPAALRSERIRPRSS